MSALRQNHRRDQSEQSAKVVLDGVLKDIALLVDVLPTRLQGVKGIAR